MTAQWRVTAEGLWPLLLLALFLKRTTIFGPGRETSVLLSLVVVRLWLVVVVVVRTHSHALLSFFFIDLVRLMISPPQTNNDDKLGLKAAQSWNWGNIMSSYWTQKGANKAVVQSKKQSELSVRTFASCRFQSALSSVCRIWDEFQLLYWLQKALYRFEKATTPSLPSKRSNFFFFR